ncbi:hypothetical protein [Parasphingorhabdus pacifica]
MRAATTVNGGVRVRQRELARLCRVAVDRSGVHCVFTFAVSIWVAVWIAGRFTGIENEPSPLTLLVEVGGKFGVDGQPWADQIAREWSGIGGLTAAAGGLLWACASERGQAPAVFGWVAVMLASEDVGYRPAVLTAFAVLVGFPVLLWVIALFGGQFVDRRAKLLPTDVVRAGVTAATLSAIVPVFAFGVCLTRLFRPYLTRAPRPVPDSGCGHPGHVRSRG